MLDVLDGEPRAVDTHAHQPTSEFLHDAGGEMIREAAETFGADMETKSYEEMIEEYHAAGVGRAVLLGWDAETNTGNPPVSNDYLAEVRGEYPDFLIRTRSFSTGRTRPVRTFRAPSKIPSESRPSRSSALGAGPASASTSWAAGTEPAVREDKL